MKFSKFIKFIFWVAIISLLIFWGLKLSGFNLGLGMLGSQQDTAKNSSKIEQQEESYPVIEIKEQNIYFKNKEVQPKDIKSILTNLDTDKKIIKLKLQNAKQATYKNVKTIIENEGFAVIEE
ncbi:MAG: hypothetical protein PWP27_1231 [Clostridiales bacterium]|jgi:biopolymer transport protein ExbD|nr:hypothetical protein [Clostridiales bacterium]MDK2933421.1 hypothetical protein [Clostridiales bacterium]